MVLLARDFLTARMTTPPTVFLSPLFPRESFNLITGQIEIARTLFLIEIVVTKHELGVTYVFVEPCLCSENNVSNTFLSRKYFLKKSKLGVLERFLPKMFENMDVICEYTTYFFKAF